MKNERGISLITLVITIILLGIITSTLMTNAYDSVQISRLTKLDNDIKVLNDRIAVYYVEHEELPIYGRSYTMDELEHRITPADNDGNEYYVIDLNMLSNLTLNYGEEYVSFYKEGNALTFEEDMYIINTESHIVYYLKGIKYKGVEYHTLGDYSTVSLNYDS